MYQGARNVYGRYADVNSKGVECVYDLTEKPLMFLDMGLIYPGMIIWCDIEGTAHPLHATPEYYGDTRLKKEEVVGKNYRVPEGLVFEAQPAERGPATPRGRGTLLYEDGIYRLWQNERLGIEFEELRVGDDSKGFDLQTIDAALYYFESDDGVTWRAPEFDFFMDNDNKTNIVYGSMLTPEKVIGFGGMSVYKDPSAPPKERYKGLYASRLPISTLAEHCKKRKIKFDPMSIMVKISRLFPDQFDNERLYYDVVVKGLLPKDLSSLPECESNAFFGAVSPDGLQWNGIEEPVMPFMAEGGKPFFDVEKEKSVCYVRYWQNAQRRGIGITETEDFRLWPQPRPLLCPDFNEELGTDYYTNVHTLYPGTTDVHLFFVSKFHHGTNDCLDLYLAVSLDGDLINFVPGGPVISCETEEWDPDQAEPAACVFPGYGMTPFGQDHVGIIVTEHNIPHKWPRTVQQTSNMHWALWEKERIVALRARERGAFTSSGLVLTKPIIYINCKTESAGEIRVQLMDDSYKPVPGCSLSECDPINGNHRKTPLTWGGKSVPTDYVGRKIYLRFEMSRARLFSICAGN